MPAVRVALAVQVAWVAGAAADADVRRTKQSAEPGQFFPLQARVYRALSLVSWNFDVLRAAPISLEMPLCWASLPHPGHGAPTLPVTRRSTQRYMP